MSYTRFQDNDIVTRQAAELVTSTWTNNVNNLVTAHSSSAQANFTTSTSSGQFFIEVYNTASDSSDAEVQYSVAYGHRNGSGSPDFTNDTGSFGLGASRVIYNQYRQLVFGDDKDSGGTTQFFTFGTHTPDDIYIINVNRSRYKQKLTLGSLNLNLSGSQVGQFPAQQVIHLTDDSVTTSGGQGNSNLGTYYNIVSGSNGTVLSGTTAVTQVGGTGSFGHFYPEAGLIILNADAFSGSLDPSINDGGPVANVDKNHQELYGSNNIRFETMKLNPKVFITTIGLYNDALELLAVAKLSQPVAKDFTKEALIRVKLDY